MFSLIKNMIRAGQLYETLDSRLRSIETKISAIQTKIEKLENFAEESAALLDYLEAQEEPDGLFVGTAEDFEAQISDMMLRHMKTKGDA